MPRVKQLLNPWRREYFIFFTGHGPFVALGIGPFGEYWDIFGLLSTSYCACGNHVSPLHYVTECHLTESWHLWKLEPTWKTSGFNLSLPVPSLATESDRSSSTSIVTVTSSHQINKSSLTRNFSTISVIKDRQQPETSDILNIMIS
ncbi:hypothetical protein AVEN_7375-1 [Araneus ventricosus]|uniref:Uncharacterized protein n=1 Tax=Araneus ventricosus TaxID=182803 RepID=A0A4Y2BR20_ARAVE|nr:hypothetical protein AVEN_7375-1 [Araneus ventricosus]